MKKTGNLSGFNAYMHVEKPVFIPGSCQKLLQAKAVTRDGIMELPGNKFSSLWKFGDINYRGNTEDENDDILLRLSGIYDSIPDDFKIIIWNRSQSEEQLKEGYLYGHHYPIQKQNEVADAIDRLFLDRLEEGRHGLKQEKYLLVTAGRKNREAASSHFVELDSELVGSFGEMGSPLLRMNGEERVNILHDFFHPDRDGYHFDYDAAKKNKRDWKNDVCPSGIQSGENELKIDGRYYRFLYIRLWPESGIDDRFISELTNLPYPMLVTMDFSPIPAEATNTRLEKMYMAIEKSIYKEKRFAAREGVVASDNFYKEKESGDIRNTMMSISKSGASMLFVGLTVGITADSIENLDTITESVQSTAQAYGFTLDIAWLRQTESLMTALPVGVRQTATMRTLLSQRAAALMPFATKELSDWKGEYYGQNPSSKQPIVIDRHLSVNGNGFTFGSTGSGKSMINKFINQQMILREAGCTCFYFIDPQQEKKELVEMNGGSYVSFGVTSGNRMNPLEYSIDEIDDSKKQTEFLARKINFLVALVQLNADFAVTGVYKNIINRCTLDLYQTWFAGGMIRQPQLEDFYQLLTEQEEPEARDIAMAMESMIIGPLSIFNCQSTVMVDNDIIGFGFEDLSEDLLGAALLVIMEHVSHQLSVNSKRGYTTYIDIEEFHYVVKYPVAAEYFVNWYKMIRKMSGMLMATTQNVSDAAQNETMKSMISNSDFMVLMAQNQSDIDLLSEITGIDSRNLKRLRTAAPGTGIIKHGASLIAFDNRLPDTNPLYQLWNTDDNAKKAARAARADMRIGDE